MKIQNLKISGIGGIKELELELNDEFNVICGANGVGKTTILNVIIDCFCGVQSSLKRNKDYTSGKYQINFIDDNGNKFNKEHIIREYEPTNNNDVKSVEENSLEILYFSINRMIDYVEQNSIPRDPARDKYCVANNALHDIRISDFKGWFINRYLFYDKPGSLTEEQKHNFEIAKQGFSLMDSSVTFNTVNSSNLDIKLNTNRGEIYFEYLSSGYKTCLYIIMGIIKEIEFRFKNPTIKVGDFEGVVLIDEIDLHLHPTWQRKFIDVLRTVFPKVQFIVTTHSPHIIQNLIKTQIIPLVLDDSGNIKVKNLNLGRYGLQGWTIEEILNEVMGMYETNTEFYSVIQEKFDRAMNEEDIEEIRKYYNILQDMLHKNNIIKQMLKVQVAGMDIENDKVNENNETEGINI